MGEREERDTFAPLAVPRDARDVANFSEPRNVTESECEFRSAARFPEINFLAAVSFIVRQPFITPASRVT